MFVYVKTALNPVSHNFPMDISELCVSPDMICPSLDVSGSCGNANVHYLVDINFPPFWSPNMIGGVLHVVCSLGLLVLV